MNVDLSLYRDKKICVAVSGGKDSMALLHYIKAHGGDFNITLSAVNCDHSIRGAESERDSAFVREYCAANAVSLYFYKWNGERFRDEGDARLWRLCCYNNVITEGKADLIATAHHMNDNAETVLFNLARGTGLGGMTGITDASALNLARPLIGCTRAEIDAYIDENDIPFVTDSTNLSDDYTRNKIRNSVLPSLEAAVPGAVKNIFRFSRLAAEDDEYLERMADGLISSRNPYGFIIAPCVERVLFKRAAHKIVAAGYGKKDYTAEHFERLFALQSAENGKRFEFLGLTAVKEDGGIAICDDFTLRIEATGMPFKYNFDCDQELYYCKRLAAADREEYLGDILSCLGQELTDRVKVLKYDADKIPPSAVIRFKRTGDKFTKFGGGTKSLGDYLTDKKVPQSLRGLLPLVCDGNEVLIVGGVEISEKVKITDGTEIKGVFVCADPFKE